MIRPEQFAEQLAQKGFRFYTGVPCSYFKHVIRHVESTAPYSYYAAPNEGSALAAASGAFLAGQGAVVLIQNSGLGNLVNPLTSLSMIYKMPALLFVSGRAYGIPDEPQHEIMGKTMGAQLDALGIAHWDLPQEEDKWRESLDRGILKMQETGMPVVFFVRKGTFSPQTQPLAASHNDNSRFPMKRIEAISIIRDAIREEDAVFAATGKISREFFAVADRPGNFYMQGSMGHISAVAFGYAVSNPEIKTIALDGDGAFLMHMGNASMAGHYAPQNFLHIVLDNEAYETTGDQDTTASTADLAAIARASGYKKTLKVTDAGELRQALPDFLSAPGPSFLWVKINRVETPDIPRITTKYSAPEIARNFKKFTQSRKPSRAGRA